MSSIAPKMEKVFSRSRCTAVLAQSLAATMNLMIEGGFQEEREAAGKWVRAQLSSTQLSTYFVGY